MLDFSALAVWEPPVALGGLAPAQIWVEVEALVELPALRMPSDPLLVLSEPPDSAQAVYAVLEHPLLALASWEVPLALSRVAPVQEQEEALLQLLVHLAGHPLAIYLDLL